MAGADAQPVTNRIAAIARVCFIAIQLRPFRAGHKAPRAFRWGDERPIMGAKASSEGALHVVQETRGRGS